MRIHRRAVAISAAAALALGTALGGAPSAQADPSGAVWTVISPEVADGSTVCQNGNPTQNCNQYYHQEDVYLNATQITPGDYMFAVVVPSGKADPSDRSATNLSAGFDTLSDRKFTVEANGDITMLGTHPVVKSMIQLAPFDDTTNNGGVYQAVVCPMTAVLDEAKGLIDATRCSKSDNFKVRNPSLPISYGALTVAAPDAQQSYTLETYQPYWQRTLQPIWQKVLLPVWQMTLQPIWQKTYQDVWQKTLQPVSQKTYQQYDAPVYKMDTKTINDTLVTRIYDGPGKTATVLPNSGTFKNGHTYVGVNVTTASQPGGVAFMIADSSYNSNGKKTPDQYNTPIGYTYNVTTANGQLTISFDDLLMSASVGAYLACSVDGFPGNAPKHVTVTSGQSVSFALPAPCATSDVLLYTHFEGLSWYSSDYKKVGTQIIPSKTELVSDELVRTDTVTDQYLRTDLVFDKWLRADITNNELLRTDVVSDKLVYTKTASDVLDHTELVSSQTQYEAYAGDFAVSVADASDAVVCQGDTVAACATIDNLKPGAYTVTLTGSDRVEHPMTVAVVADTSVAADFAGLIVATDQVRTTDLPKVYLDDIVNEKSYRTDIVLPKIYAAPIVLDKTYADPITLDTTYADPITLDTTYLDDIVLPVIHLDDAFAIYLNGPKA